MLRSYGSFGEVFKELANENSLAFSLSGEETLR